jgi:fumarylpyruvate hydrolase
MGDDPSRDPPFFFQKPGDSVVDNNSVLPYPPMTTRLDHEIELVVALHSGGWNITPADALSHVFGYAVGLDMTRRDLQTEAKAKSRPWEMGKSFDQSAPIAALRPVADVGHVSEGAIWVRVAGVERQRSDLRNHIWGVADTIAFLSKYVEVAAGDVIMMGTPAGVGPVAAGEEVHGHIDGLGDLYVRYTASA